MKLYYHPVSSYSQKVLIAFYEKNVSFERMIVDLMTPKGREDYLKIYPIGTIPFLKDEKRDWTVAESSNIIEYIDHHHPGGVKLIPDDADLARQIRMRDRLFDNYVNDPMQKIFFDGMRPAGKNDPYGVEEARRRIEAAYGILDEMLGKTGGPWVMGKDFTMADCAAAPPLAYAKMVQPFDKYKNLVGYLGRMMERPSFQRCLKEAAPFLAALQGK